MTAPEPIEATQVEYIRPTVSDTMTCDYCITQEEYERLCDEPATYTITYSSTEPPKQESEQEKPSDKHTHFACLALFHTEMSKLRTGFKRVGHWKRTRSRLFTMAQRDTDNRMLVIVVILLLV